jgi:hypothetical protein
MAKLYRKVLFEVATGVAVDWPLVIRDNFDVKRIGVLFSAEVSTPEALKVWLEPAGFDPFLLFSQNMLACNYLNIENIDGISYDDDLSITFPNTDALTIRGFAVVDNSP